MPSSGRTMGAGRAQGETWLLAAFAFVCYAALRQEALHGTDWRWLVLWLDEPGAVHPQHPGYLPLARALRWLASPLALDVHAVLCVFSALGGAAAVAGLHRAALALDADRAAARSVALLAMCTPALFHFATVCELHAPFAGVMAFALLAAVRWAKGGRARAALASGALSGAATLLHATGHLLVPGIAVAVCWANRARPLRWHWERGAQFALAHAAVWGGVFALLRATGHLPESVAGFAARPDDLAAPDNPVAYLLRWWRGMDLAAQFGPTVLHEWLLPYLPASVLAFAAWRRRDLRPAALLLLAALLAYLVVTVALVHAYTDERGAYLLPLLFPAVVLMQRALPVRSRPLLLALTVAAGLLCRGEPGRLPPDRAFGRAAAALALQQKTVFFVAGFPEMDGAFLADAKLDLLVALAKYDELRAAGLLAATPEQIAGWLQLQAAEQRQKGAQLVITDAAVHWLGERLPAFAPAWAAFVPMAGATRLPPAVGIAGVAVR